MEDPQMKRRLMTMLLALGLPISLALWQANPSAAAKTAVPLAPMATITVNSVADDAPANNGQCTLREAILNANGANQSGSTDCVAGGTADNTINFSVTGAINLTGALPDITRTLTITGPDARLLTVRRDTGGDYRIFNIPNHGLVIVISGLTISNGRSTNGGGIFSSSNLTLTDCAIQGNYADNAGGGVVLLNGASGVFTGCTFSGNTSLSTGGGIHFGGSTLRLSHCTISDNYRGGIYVSGGTVEVVNCTIVGNPGGGGITVNGTGYLRNTIIAHNLFNLSGDLISLGNNLSSDSNNAFLLNQPTDQINTNPLLGSLADNGGPTQTRALLLGSPAIDAGNSCVTTNNCASNNLGFNLTTDQRGAGFPRLVGGTVDMGAFEKRSGVPTHLAFGVQPTFTPLNSVITPAVTVQVMDDDNNILTASTATITLALGANPGGATLGGTLSRAAVSGVATFNNLTINQAGRDYKLTASSSGLPGAISNAFNICPTMTVTLGTNPSVNYGTLSANLPYTTTSNPNRFSIDYDAAANAAGFADVTNEVLPASPIVLTIPGTALPGTFNATLTLNTSTSTNNCPSNTAPFTVTVQPCLTATFTVNSLGDTPDANPGNQVCADGAGNCTLRAALMEANALGLCAALTINFSVTGTLNLTGALPDIIRSLTITGPGAKLLTVRRNTASEYRIFHIPNGGLNIVISGLTISNGFLNTLNPGGGPVDLGLGGGIRSLSPLTLTDCVISGNAALWGGGVFLGAGGVFTGCTFNSNSSFNYGGGINLSGGTLRLSNCTISDNFGDSGGGGILTAGTLEVTNCTITGNTHNIFAPPLASGIYVDRGTTRLRNTIVANNQGINLRVITGSLTSLGNNLTNDDGGGFLNQPTDKINTDPLLGPLANNSGPTQTQALLAGSPAINAGANCVTTNNCPSNNLGFNLTTDQRGAGFNRQVGSAVDMGAYEVADEVSPNHPPTISGASLTRQQGTAASNSLIATVNDQDELETGLSVTVAPLSGSGITLSNISVDFSGNVTADLAANCTATNATFTLRVTDNAGAFAEATLTVTVTLNTPPVLSYNNQMVTAGTTPMFLPVTEPSDNGAVSSITLQSVTPPVGLTLNVNNVTGEVIVTSATLTGNYTVVIRANDNCAPGAGTFTDAAFTVTVTCPTITLHPANMPNATAHMAYPQTFSASPAGGNYSFTVIGGFLPTGLTLNSNGSFSGWPTVTGTFNFTVNVSGFGGNCQQSFARMLTVVCPTVTLNPASLPNAAVNMAYGPVITASPVGGNYSFAVTDGALPTGLTLNSNGSFSGTPTQAGTFNFRITGTAASGCSGFRDYQLLVTCPTITLAPLPQAIAGVLFNTVLSASPAGGSYQFSSADKPAWLTLAANGNVSGTPPTAGAFTFNVNVSGFGTCQQSFTVTLTVGCPALTLAPLPQAAAGVLFNVALNASPVGGNYQFSSANLPAWLMLATNGNLSGTPPATGTFNFNVNVSGFGSCAQTLAVTLQVICPALSLTPATLPNGVQGTAYHQTLAVPSVGGNYSYAVTTGVLPPGLTLASTGLLSGTPTASGNYAFSVTATGWGGCTKTQSYNLLITGTCSTITLNPTSLSPGALGTAYTQTLSAAGGVAPYNYSVLTGALPAGLTLNANTGELSGVPTTTGTFIFTVRATAQGGCTGQRLYVLSIACGPLTFAPAALPSGTKGAAYSQQLSVSPASSATFSLLLGSLPPGFTLSSTGLLSGTTSQAGTYNFTVKALAGSCQGTKAYALVISTGMAALALSGDYDGDGKTDPALWSAKDGVWRIVRSSDGQAETQGWGTAGDVTLLGDYDGDGKSDLAVFRPAEATFYVKRSSDGGYLIKQWGLATDVPVPGDYDSDGKTDIAVWRGSNGTWYIVRSSDGQPEVQVWGSAAAPYQDLPMAGDYDGDGKSDVAVFRRATGTWLVKHSSDGQYLVKQWGLGTDVPVAADYDGDGKTDIAVWRGVNGTWYIWQSATNAYRVSPWGTAGDQAGAGDYDGDGKADSAVWRGAEQIWYIRCSANDTTLTKAQGQRSDRPVPAALR
jgi:CSLREA domain-containing protein